MTDVEALHDALQGSRRHLFESLRGLTEEQFRAPADGSGWSIAVHLGHLLRCERMLVERSHRALDADEPRIASTGITNDDDPGLTQHLAVPQIIHGLQASRRDLEVLLKRAGDSGLDRGIVHQRQGRVTVRAMVEKMAAHEQEHAADVAALARQAARSRPVTIPLSPRS